MPRVPKKEHLVKLELDGFPTVLTREYLEGLHRAQIQELAKRYGIKANLKSAAIINQLVGDVEQDKPALAAPTFTTGDAPQNVLQLSSGEGSVQVVNSAPGAGVANTSASGANDKVKPTDTSTGVNKRTRAAPYPGAKERGASKKGSSKKAPEEAESPKQEPLVNPTVKDVRRVRRLLVTLNEERVGMRKDLEDTKSMLAAAQRALAGATDNVKAISWRRELYERDILAKMKSNRSLWDGTPHMAPKDRKKWESFVTNHWEKQKQVRDALGKAMEGLREEWEEDGEDADNELSNDEDEETLNRPASQTMPAAREEVDYDDMYV